MHSSEPSQRPLGIANAPHIAAGMSTAASLSRGRWYVTPVLKPPRSTRQNEPLVLRALKFLTLSYRDRGTHVASGVPRCRHERLWGSLRMRRPDKRLNTSRCSLYTFMDGSGQPRIQARYSSQDVLRTGTVTRSQFWLTPSPTLTNHTPHDHVTPTVL